MVVPKHAAAHIAERDGHRPGECGDVYDPPIPHRVCVGHRVRQDEPPLGVRVVYLDGLSVHRPHNVPGPLRAAARHVLRCRYETRYVDLRLRLSNHLHGCNDSRAARHVALHLPHSLGRLQGNPPAVERYALAHDGQAVGGVVRISFVLQDDHLWRLLASLRHAEQCPHTQILHLAAVEHFQPQAGAAGCAQRTLRHPRRGHPIRGFVDHVPAERDRIRNERPTIHAVPQRGQLGCGVIDDIHRLDRLAVVLWRLVLVEFVEAENRPLCDSLCRLPRIHPPNSGSVCNRRKPPDADLPQPPRRLPRYSAHGLRVKLRRLSQPNDRNSCRRNLAQGVDDGNLPFLARDLAVPDELRDAAPQRAVYRPGRPTRTNHPLE